MSGKRKGVWERTLKSLHPNDEHCINQLLMKHAQASTRSTGASEYSLKETLIYRLLIAPQNNMREGRNNSSSYFSKAQRMAPSKMHTEKLYDKPMAALRPERRSLSTETYVSSHSSISTKVSPEPYPCSKTCCRKSYGYAHEYRGRHKSGTCNKLKSYSRLKPSCGKIYGHNWGVQNQLKYGIDKGRYKGEKTQQFTLAKDQRCKSTTIQHFKPTSVTPIQGKDYRLQKENGKEIRDDEAPRLTRPAPGYENKYCKERSMLYRTQDEECNPCPSSEHLTNGYQNRLSEKATTGVNDYYGHLRNESCTLLDEPQSSRAVLELRTFRSEPTQETVNGNEIEAFSTLEELLQRLLSSYNRCRLPARSGVNGSSADKDQDNMIAGPEGNTTGSGSSNNVEQNRDSAESSQVHFAGKWSNVKDEHGVNYVDMLERSINDVLRALSTVKMPNLRFSVGSKLISDNSVRAVYTCECLNLQKEGEDIPPRLAQCSVRGCPLPIPIYEAPLKCSGYLEVIVDCQRVARTRSLYQHHTTIIFKHPFGMETRLPSAERPPVTQKRLRVTPAHRMERPEMDAAVAKDMELLNDPIFSSYIRGKLDLLYAVGPLLSCNSKI